MASLLAHQPAILLALAGTRAYIHSHDVALDHVVFLLRALLLCLAQHYTARTCVSSSLDVELDNRSPEGRYDPI